MSTKSGILGRPGRRLSALAGAAVALALALTACGSSTETASTTSAAAGSTSAAASSAASSNSSAAASGGPAASAAPAPTGDLTKIQVMRPLNTGFEPLVIAQDQGIWAKNGLDVELVLASADTSAGIPRMLNGEVQFVNGGGPQIIKAVSSELPVTLVSGLQSSDASTQPTDGLLVPADSDIKSLKDLEGKTVGVSGLGGTTNVVNNIALRNAGVDPSTVTYVNLAPPALQAAAESGQVDAVLIFGLYYTQATGSGFRSIEGSGTNGLPGTLQIGYLTTNDYLAQNPETVEKFTKALSEANDYANAHPDAVRAAQTQFTQLPPDYIASAVIPPYSSDINVDTLNKLAEELVAEGTIPEAPATDQMVWTGAPTS
jgi:ABC-type nitrate/sulfonate/bicarbonate transport system substrate-binding protein